MGASLIQLYRVGDEGYIDCKTLSLKEGLFKLSLENLTWIKEEAPANSVPAAAVRQEERVLFELIGRKGHVGGEM